MADTDSFDVVVKSQLDADTEVVTVVPKGDADIAAWEDKFLYSAIQNYDSNKTIYSSFTLETQKADGVRFGNRLKQGEKQCLENYRFMN